MADPIGAIGDAAGSIVGWVSDAVNALADSVGLSTPALALAAILTAFLFLGLTANARN